MSNLITALRDRISALEDERDELEDALNRIAIKIQTYEELLAEEDVGLVSVSPKRKPGRPKKGTSADKSSDKGGPPKKISNHAVADTLWQEASTALPAGVSPSTAEEQERARARFNPVPRQQPNYGVKAGRPEDVMGDSGKKKSNVSISVEDGDK